VSRYDFNSSLADGPTFGVVDVIQGPFEQFLSKCFNANEEIAKKESDDKAAGSGKSQKKHS
jgi:hypothetical protein